MVYSDLKVFKAGALIREWAFMQMRFKKRATRGLFLALLLVLCDTAPPLRAQVSTDQLAEHQELAQKAQAAGDFETAIREYQLLAHALPKNGAVESNLGVALYFHHDLEKAADVFHRAVALDPSLHTPHVFLWVVMVRLSQSDAAIAE